MYAMRVYQVPGREKSDEERRDIERIREREQMRARERGGERKKEKERKLLTYFIVMNLVKNKHQRTDGLARAQRKSHLKLLLATLECLSVVFSSSQVLEW